MPAQWTAELLGEMHLAGVSSKQLAAEAGWNEKYLSAVLNGHREPRKAEQTLRAALLRLEIKKAQRDHGLSDDLSVLLERYRAIDPDYAECLSESIGLSGEVPV